MNDADLRDERLGELLDLAVRDVEPRREMVPSGAAPVGNRWVRLVAAALTAAVFVGVVAWAATQAGREAGRRDSTPASSGPARLYSSPDVPWVFEYPDGWNASTTMRFDPMFLGTVRRTTVVNGSLPSSAGSVGPHSPNNDVFTEEIGDAGLAVIVQRYWSRANGVVPEAPQAPGPFIDEAQPPGWTFRERARCEGTLCFLVVEWIGPAASEEDRAAAEAIAASVRSAGHRAWTETDEGWTTFHDEAGHLTVSYPDDWVVAGENLTPWLASPTEILSLGTFPLRVSTDPDDELRVFDAPAAPLALADMAATDAFISVQESDDDPASFAARPELFPPPMEHCQESFGICRLQTGPYPFGWWWIPFEDEGRAFYLFVAIGNDASPELVDESWAVADSLRFYPSVG